MVVVRGEAPSTARLDVVVAGLVPDLSRSRAAKLIEDGRVVVDGEVVTKRAATVPGGARVEVRVPPPTPAEAVPQDLPVRIVHEDGDLVVVDKTPGMVVHPGAGHPDGTLVNALLHHVDDLSGIGGVERPGIVHRLDRGTSGLLVVAKHDRAHQHLAAQFAAHTARRTYLAITLAAPDSDAGTIASQLARHPKERVRFASVPTGGKRAVTHWSVEGRSRGLGLVRCELETGRTHEIRVHLTEQGWPLAGDPVYTRRDRRPAEWLADLLPPERPMLHAWTLALDHPSSGERVTFVAPVPGDMAAVLSEAGLPDPSRP